MKVKRLYYSILLIFILSCGGKLNKIDEIINLAKMYQGKYTSLGRNYSEIALKRRVKGTEFEKIGEFIIEEKKEKNNLVKNEFLVRPDSSTLKIFHTTMMLHYRMYQSTNEENIETVEHYINQNTIVFEQLMEYYESLFKSIVNHNRPFNYSDLNWDLEKLEFKNDQEKAVFFLVFIDVLGSQISSYHKAMKGPNWDGIFEYAPLLPKINGKAYFEYNLFSFKDFKIVINEQEQSFKDYFLPKFYDVLLGHLLMMEAKNIDLEEVQFLWKNSILSHEEYYLYCDKNSRIREIAERLKKNGL